MKEWLELITKEVQIVAYRGVPDRLSKHSIPIDYILFDDKKTFIYLEEQDTYTCHDCSMYARTLSVREDPIKWKALYDKEKPYRESNTDF